MKIKYCPNCGFCYSYLEFTKKEGDEICLYCFYTEKKKYKFEERDVNFKQVELHCRECNSLWLIQETMSIPPFLNILDHTFYCGCKDITSLLKSSNIGEFIQFVNPKKN